MRFAPSTASRQDRMDQLRRDRATARVLREAFPTVRQLRIELKFEAPSSNPPAPQSHVLHPPARAFFEFPCAYWDCDGQFDLSDAVNAALADSTHRAEGVLDCRGSRGAGRASRHACVLRVVYDVSATFQQHN